MTERTFWRRLHARWAARRPPVVSVLRLDGVIGGGGRFQRGLNLDGLADEIDAAFAGARVRAVALAINSPGGAPVQAELIRQRLVSLSREKEVPIYAFCEDVAASGGYWLACAASKIYAQDASVVGSIGVISAGFGAPELLAKIGVERRVYAAGERKGMLDPFQAENPDDVAHLAELQRDIHDGFKTLVRDSRGERLQASEAELFNGAFWTGRRALALGLVDAIGDLRTEMRDEFGPKVRFRQSRRKRGLLARLGLGRSAAGAALGADLLDGIEARALWARFGR